MGDVSLAVTLCRHVFSRLVETGSGWIHGNGVNIRGDVYAVTENIPSWKHRGLGMMKSQTGQDQERGNGVGHFADSRRPMQAGLRYD